MTRKAYLCGLAAFAVAVAAWSARADDEPKKEPAKEDTKKKEDPKKTDNFPFPIPDLDKLLPPGLDPEQAKQIKKQMEMMREHMRKVMEMQKEMQKGFPGAPGAFPPNFQPAFPPNLQPPNFQQFPGFPFGPSSNNRLGAALEEPSSVLVEQLDLPKGQGIVLNQVKPESTAAKAGLKTNDILLELAGKPVPNKLPDFVKSLNAIKTGEEVDAVVLRRGKKESVKGMKLPD